MPELEIPVQDTKLISAIVTLGSTINHIKKASGQKVHPLQKS